MLVSSICAGVRRGTAVAAATIFVRASACQSSAPAAAMPSNESASQRVRFDIVISTPLACPPQLEAGHARASCRWLEVGEGVRVTPRIGDVVGAQREREVVAHLV